MTSISSTLSNCLFNIESFRAYIEPIAQLISPNSRLNGSSAKITNVCWNNKNCYTLTIRPPKNWQGFKAGQSAQLTVKKNGAYLSRYFSISSPPYVFRQSGEIQLTIRTQDMGAVTPWMATHLKPGETVYLSEAQGDFVTQTTDKSKLFVAGGSGITPIISILREHKNAKWLSKSHLIFYVRSPSERLFTKELNELKLNGFSYEFIFTASQGRFSFKDISENVPDFTDRETYICGPEGLINQVNNALLENGTPSDQIFFELFGPKRVELSPDQHLTDEAIYIEYEHSRRSSELSKEEAQKTLLDLAEQEGLKPVSGCRIGVCHQCICKKKQGRVLNTKTNKVSDSGEEEIQLCLSIPLEHVTLEL